MERTFSAEFKKIFLLTFTKELISHSQKRDIIKLQKIIELEEERETKILTPKKIEIPLIKKQEIIKKEPIKEERKLEKKFIPKITAKQIPIPKPRIKPITRQAAKSSLFVSEPKLPSHLEYLKPTPTAGVEIDLLKLNPLIKDPAVRIIEVDPDEKVIVTGTMGTRPTNIILTKEDIERVINKFSEISKIPVTEGVYKVVVGNLILSAIISEVVGSKFVIKKMAYSVKQQYLAMPKKIIPFGPIKK